MLTYKVLDKLFRINFQGQALFDFTDKVDNEFYIYVKNHYCIYKATSVEYFKIWYNNYDLHILLLNKNQYDKIQCNNLLANYIMYSWQYKQNIFSISIQNDYEDDYYSEFELSQNGKFLGILILNSEHTNSFLFKKQMPNTLFDKLMADYTIFCFANQNYLNRCFRRRTGNITNTYLLHKKEEDNLR